MRPGQDRPLRAASSAAIWTSQTERLHVSGYAGQAARTCHCSQRTRLVLMTCSAAHPRHTQTLNSISNTILQTFSTLDNSDFTDASATRVRHGVSSAQDTILTGIDEDERFILTLTRDEAVDPLELSGTSNRRRSRRYRVTSPPLPPPHPLELSGTVTAGDPTVSGNITAIAPPAITPLELSGTITAGDPTVSGNLSAIAPPAITPLELSGTITAGDPTVSGNITAVAVAAPLELSGTVTAGDPTVSGNIRAIAAVTPQELSGTVTAGDPTVSGDIRGQRTHCPPKQSG